MILADRHDRKQRRVETLQVRREMREQRAKAAKQKKPAASSTGGGTARGRAAQSTQSAKAAKLAELAAKRQEQSQKKERQRAALERQESESRRRDEAAADADPAAAGRRLGEAAGYGGASVPATALSEEPVSPVERTPRVADASSDGARIAFLRGRPIRLPPRCSDCHRLSLSVGGVPSIVRKRPRRARRPLRRLSASGSRVRRLKSGSTSPSLRAPCRAALCAWASASRTRGPFTASLRCAPWGWGGLIAPDGEAELRLMERLNCA